MAEFIRHESCPHCGSSDANALYSDGSYFCFSCGTYTPPEGGPIEVVKTKEDKPFYEPVYVELKRGISKETASRYNYGVAKTKHEIVHVANYYWNGELKAQHIRTRDKKFFWRGSTEQIELFGQHTHHHNASILIITEGEIDAMSVAQCLNPKVYTVVSVPNGAQSAAKYLSMNLEFIEQFKKIIIWFDNDEAGKEAVNKALDVLPAHKVYIVNSDLKDANEVLLKQGCGAINELISTAQLYKPEHIILPKDIPFEDLVKNDDNMVYKTGYKGLNKFIHGLRKHELVIVGAGTGVGKSTFMRHLAYQMMEQYPDLKIAYFAFEETVLQTLVAFVAIANKIPFGDLWEDRGLITPEQYKASLEKIQDRLVLYDHFGWLDPEVVLKKIEYVVKAFEVDFVFLDHLTMLTYNLDLRQDERRSIDHLITRLRTLINKLPVGVVAVSHLNMRGNKAHEEGGRVTLEHLRGSGSIKQLADLVLALERNLQSKDPEKKHSMKLRVLKSRITGETGICSILQYQNGVLIEKESYAPYEFEEYEEDGDEEF